MFPMIPKTPIERSYVIGTLVSLTFYLTTLFLAVSVANGHLLAGWALYVVAALPGVAIVGQLLVTLRYLSKADEFVRALLSKRLIAAAVLTFAAFSVWGFMESFAQAPHVPGWCAYVVFWGLYGVLCPLIRTTH